MPISVASYGQLSEITGKNFEVDVTDTDQLARWLHEKYQELGKIKYMVAVNKKMVTANTSLGPADSVALLPPYSGG